MVAKKIGILFVLLSVSKSINAQDILFGLPPNIEEGDAGIENFNTPEFIADALFSEEHNSENEIFEEDFGVPDISRYC